MLNCPRCNSIVAQELAFCAACGRSRVVESLRAPAPSPHWLGPLLEKVLLVLTLWFGITLAVAYLREAKAVRDARGLIAADDLQQAELLLRPFLAEHPNHVQANYLEAQVAARFGVAATAQQSLKKVRELEPGLVQSMTAACRSQITLGVRELGCDVDAFKGRWQWAVSLDPQQPLFVDSVIEGVDEVIASCVEKGNYQGIVALVEVFKERGRTQDLATKGFVPAVRRANGGGRKRDAQNLTQFGEYYLPEAATVIRGALAPAH